MVVERIILETMKAGVMPAHAFKSRMVKVWNNAWMILSNPQSFFSLLHESSAVSSLSWVAGGISLMVFLGGLLSVVLSLIVGVPGSEVLAFVASDKTWLAYLIFLVLWYLKLVGFSVLGIVVYHASAWSFGGSGSFAKTAQILGYASTPTFLAFSLPQVLVKDMRILNPLVRLISSSFNFSVDMIQIASLVWMGWIMYIGSKELYGFSRLKSWMFVILPGTAMSGLVGVYFFIEAWLVG